MSTSVEVRIKHANMTARVGVRRISASQCDRKDSEANQEKMLTLHGCRVRLIETGSSALKKEHDLFRSMLDYPIRIDK